MVTRMLVDASNQEETRVAIIKGTRLENFDYESTSKKKLKGNIYLAKVTRVEPSLQAIFVDYGGNRHGFISFNEVHPDYYQIPKEDKDELLRQQFVHSDSDKDDAENSETDHSEETNKPIYDRNLIKKYNIQEVIKRRQILLVKIVNEERGNKGASLTTYLSLAGRYSVLMPNASKAGVGISRKINKQDLRKKLKETIKELDIPLGMSVIVRTAGMNRTKLEIKRDYEYLLRLWGNIRESTLKASAPALIYEEANLIKRSIRDLYTKDVDEILINGEQGYQTAKKFMKQLIPSHAKRVQPYRDELPLFYRYQVEKQVEEIHNSVCELKSGGYIVLNPTEALVAIDINSGKSTKERSIQETAFKTNLEAAEEIARQMRLRDIAGLVVIDFIDMEIQEHNLAVERKLKECLRQDRARIQIGSISEFGLLEMSRQRLRSSLIESTSRPCSHCKGTGAIRSVDNIALQALRMITEEGIKKTTDSLEVKAHNDVALFILNYKSEQLLTIKTKYDINVIIVVDPLLPIDEFNLKPLSTRKAQDDEESAAPKQESVPEEQEPSPQENAQEEQEPSPQENAKEGDKKRKRRRRRRKPGVKETDNIEQQNADSGDTTQPKTSSVPEPSLQQDPPVQESSVQESSSQESSSQESADQEEAKPQDDQKLKKTRGLRRRSNTAGLKTKRRSGTRTNRSRKPNDSQEDAEGSQNSSEPKQGIVSEPEVIQITSEAPATPPAADQSTSPTKVNVQEVTPPRTSSDNSTTYTIPITEEPTPSYTVKAPVVDDKKEATSEYTKPKRSGWWSNNFRKEQ